MLYSPASTPFAKPTWDPYGPQLIVIVGRDQNEVVFKAFANDMTFYSGYFKSLCSSPTLVDNQIRLPSDDPQIFSLVINYLSNRFLPPAIDLSFDTIISLYVFGLKRTMPLLQNISVDLFLAKIKTTKTFPDRFSVSDLWERTTPGCTLRRMLVDLIREMWIPDGRRHWVWNELVGGWSEDAERLVWVMDEFGKSGKDVRVNARMTRLGQACEWHVHEAGIVCEGSEEARLGQSGWENGESVIGKKRRWEDDGS